MAGAPTGSYKRPESVLVVIHTSDRQVLLLERADRPGFWQSVTGSLEGAEAPVAAAHREVTEETGLLPDCGIWSDCRWQNVFRIYPTWAWRYAPGTTHNTEHVFALQLAHASAITTAPGEHLAACWLPWPEAAAKVFSWSNRDAIVRLLGTP